MEMEDRQPRCTVEGGTSVSQSFSEIDDDEDGLPFRSAKQFFNMTGIRFMDEITALPALDDPPVPRQRPRRSDADADADSNADSSAGSSTIPVGGSTSLRWRWTFPNQSCTHACQQGPGEAWIRQRSKRDLQEAGGRGQRKSLLRLI